MILNFEKKRRSPALAGVLLCLILLPILSVSIYASDQYVIYPASDVWEFSTVTGSGRGREESGSYRRFSLAERALSVSTVAHNAPAVLTVSPVTSTEYKRFSASWATTQSVYAYNRVELSFSFSPCPEYASYSVFRFVVYIDNMAFGTRSDWNLISIAGISREGFPLVASVSPLGNGYFLSSIETKSIETLTFVFEHNGTEYTSGYNVGAFSLSFSSAWVDTAPDPANTITSETFRDPEISLPAVETLDLSGFEQYFRLDLPALNLAPYYSAFTWWGIVIDNTYGSLPIFSIALTVGITVGAFALVGGLYKADWRAVKAEKVEKEREAKAEARYQKRKAEYAKRYKRKGKGGK